MYKTQCQRNPRQERRGQRYTRWRWKPEVEGSTQFPTKELEKYSSWG